MRKQLLGKFRAEKDKMPPEKKTLVLTHFPRFLSLLEEEIYVESPIWDPDFKQAPPPYVQHLNSTSSSNNSERLRSSTSDSDSFSGGTTASATGSVSSSTSAAVVTSAVNAVSPPVQVGGIAAPVGAGSGGRKRGAPEDAEAASAASKRLKLEEDSLDEVIAEIVAVIDDQSKMLGESSSKGHS